MGSRASYVLLEGGQRTFWYAHWGGQTVPERLLAGPERTCAYLRTLIAVPDLLDTVWAEGGILLDRDHRRLRFFGGEDLRFSPALRREYLPVLQRLWPGWDVAWASYGMVDFARYLQMAETTVFAGDVAQKLTPCARADLCHVPARDWSFSVITVCWEDAATADLVFDLPVGHALGMGPRLLSMVRGWATEPLPREDDGGLIGGALLDVPARRLTYWEPSWLDPRTPTELERRWPGWQVDGHVEGIVRQVERSGRDPQLVLQPRMEVRRELLSTLLPSRPVDVAGVLEHMRKADPPRSVEVANPIVFTREEPVLTPEEQRQLLRELFPELAAEVAEEA